MWHRPDNILVNATDPSHQSCTAHHKATPAAAAKKMKPMPTVHRMLTTKKTDSIEQ